MTAYRSAGRWPLRTDLAADGCAGGLFRRCAEPANNLIAALPLGGRIKLDPWSDQLDMIKSKPVGAVAEREKMPFEITPFILYLTRETAGSSANLSGATSAAASGSDAQAPKIQRRPTPAGRLRAALAARRLNNGALPRDGRPSSSGSGRFAVPGADRPGLQRPKVLSFSECGFFPPLPLRCGLGWPFLLFRGRTFRFSDTENANK